MRKKKDCVGNKYNMLTVTEEVESKKGKRYVKAICQCGTEKEYELYKIQSGHSKSCGCYSNSVKKRLMTTHGLSRSRLYCIRANMINRCENKKAKPYIRYGGRGIVVCNEWKDDFMSFYNWAMSNGYSDELTIDRIDNDGNYEPNNCRWSDRKTQSLNRGLNKNNKSNYKGVFYDKENNKWISSVSFDMKTKKIGRFNTIEEAVKKRNDYIIKNNLPHKLQEYKG